MTLFVFFRLKGTVERPLKIPSSKKSGFSNSGRGNSEAFGGTIKYVDSEGKQAKIQFDGSDLNDYRGHFPFIGDEVDFQICMDKPTKKLRAVDVSTPLSELSNRLTIPSR